MPRSPDSPTEINRRSILGMCRASITRFHLHSLSLRSIPPFPAARSFKPIAMLTSMSLAYVSDPTNSSRYGDTSAVAPTSINQPADRPPTANTVPPSPLPYRVRQTRLKCPTLLQMNHLPLKHSLLLEPYSLLPCPYEAFAFFCLLNFFSGVTFSARSWIFFSPVVQIVSAASLWPQ